MKAQIDKQQINYQKGAVVSREVFRSERLTVTLFAFDQGQGLSEHKTTFHAIIHVYDGEAEVTIAGVRQTIKRGEMIQMPANTTHSLIAEKRFKMLLIMIK